MARWLGPSLSRPCFAILALLAEICLGAPEPRRHPLTEAGSSRCVTCHSGITEDKPVVHAVMDCATCHVLRRSKAGASVILTEPEPRLCLRCHKEVSRAARGALKVPHAPVRSSCTACHVPHAGDVEKLLKAPEPELCGTCHKGAKIDAKHGGLLAAVTRCATCHLPHGSDVSGLLKGNNRHTAGSCKTCHVARPGDPTGLRVRGSRLCLSCHPGSAGTAQSGSRHPMLKDDPKGRGGCLSCHDPHDSTQPDLLPVPAAESCNVCHRKLAEAANSELTCALQRRTCDLCHTPHASEKKALLSVDPSQVCVPCHNPKNAVLVKKHLGADMTKLDCLTCHSSHGDCQPSSLAKVVHPPVRDGCDACHENGNAKKLISGGGTDLCTACHDSILAAARKVAVPHKAMEVGSCRSCHNPHASPRRWLVRSPRESACGACHPAQVAGPTETAHGVIRLLGCEACHQPHGGSSRYFLRQTGSRLCLACHGPGAVKAASSGPLKVFGRLEIPAVEAARIHFLHLSQGDTRDHPVLGHRTLGTPTSQELRAAETNFSGELTCLSCHDPHKGKTKTLLVGGATRATATCQRCHRK